MPGRTTSFSLKGKDLAIQDIAREVGVAHVLEGSVRRDGERLRITAQLVDARSDAHVWSESYDRRAQDVFEVQEEIARSIAAALRVQLAAPQTGLTDARPTTSQEAWEAYLKGRYFANRRTVESLQEAIDHFRRAIALDSAFSLPWAGMAQAYGVLPSYRGQSSTAGSDDLTRAIDAAERALDLDGTVADAYAALGYAHTELGQWDEAGEALHQPQSGNPPLLGAALSRGHRPARAYPGSRSGLLGHGSHPRPMVYAITGDLEAGRREAERVLGLPGERGAAELARVATALALAGENQRAREILLRLDRERSDERLRAMVALALGEKERALSLLEPSDGLLSLQAWFLIRDPGFDPVRSDFIQVIDALDWPEAGLLPR